MKNIDKLYKCECYAEGLTKSIWTDSKHIILEIWTMGYNNSLPMPWMDRFREIWRILRHGKSNLGEVVLDYETANELADDIKKDIESCNTEK